MTALLEMRGVACWRRGGLLFEGLDLRLERGQALWVHGPNGAGKSSLLRLAAGLLKPVAGTIAGAAAALADDALALDWERSLGQALRFWARIDGGSRRLEAALDALALSGLQDVPVRMLSTGQARRARLARVAASGAPLWLLDEPLNGLDADSARRLDDLIAAHRGEGGAIIAASHASLAGDDWRVLELGR